MNCIRYLEQYVAGRTPTVLSGRVPVRDQLRSRPRAHTPVLLTGILTGQQHRVVTDSRGRFRVELPADLYQLTTRVRGMKLNMDHEVRVRGGVCTDVDIELAPDRVIAGTLRDHRGAPAAGIVVTAQDVANRDQYWYGASGKDGHYRIAELTPGRYVLSVNLKGQIGARIPLPPWFYPGEREERRAARVEVPKKPQVQTFDLTLPPPPRSVRIYLTLTAADAGPLSAVDFLIDDARGQPVFVRPRRIALGRYSLDLPEGERYRISAYSLPPAGGWSSEPAPFAVHDGTTVKLTMNRDGR